MVMVSSLLVRWVSSMHSSESLAAGSSLSLKVFSSAILQVKSQQVRLLAPTTSERAFSGTSPLPITQEGNSSHIIKGAIER